MTGEEAAVYVRGCHWNGMQKRPRRKQQGRVMGPLTLAGKIGNDDLGGGLSWTEFPGPRVGFYAPFFSISFDL